MTKIAGIDPGLASGGLVLLQPGDPERILDARGITTRPDKTLEIPEAADRQFTDAVRRARVWAQRAEAILEEWQPDIVAIEAYVDLPSRLKRRDKQGRQQNDKDRWKTPLVIGLLDPVLQALGVPVYYQHPGTQNQLDAEVGQMQEANELTGRKARDFDVVFPGDRLLDTPHKLSAWTHASVRAEHLNAH